MDFVERQEKARRFTTHLVALLAAAVALVVLAAYLLALFGLAAWDDFEGPFSWWRPVVFAVVTVAVLATVGIPMVLQMRTLRRGGAAVAKRIGGRRVRDTGDGSKEAQLHNVVEEAAVAAGIETPGVFVLPREPAVNAFAIGFGPEDAVVGVTQGALDTFTRAELGAVVSHELGHVLNGDSAINMRLLGATSGLESLTVAGTWIWQVGQYGVAGVAWVLGLGLWAAGWLGSTAATLLRASVSREREFLADAHAVELTREPWALATALIKVHTDPRRGRLRTHRSPLVSHLFLHGTTGRWTSKRLDTHPPLVERIRRLDPSLVIPEPGATHWRRNFDALKRRMRS